MSDQPTPQAERDPIDEIVNLFTTEFNDSEIWERVNDPDGYIAKLQAERDTLAGRVRQLEAVLQRFADKDNWTWIDPGEWIPGKHQVWDAEEHPADIARAALDSQ